MSLVYFMTLVFWRFLNTICLLIKKKKKKDKKRTFQLNNVALTEACNTCTPLNNNIMSCLRVEGEDVLATFVLTLLH